MVRRVGLALGCSITIWMLVLAGGCENRLPTTTTLTPFESGTFTPPEAGAQADAPPIDTGVDVTDARPEPSLVLVAIGATSMPPSFGTSFSNGTWSTLMPIGNDHYGAVGGGVTFLPGGRALGVLRTNASPRPSSALWDGTWAPLTPFGTGANALSAPAATTTGAFMVDTQGPAVSTRLWTFTDSTSMWSNAPEPTGVSNNNRLNPAVAVTAAGAPLVISATTGYEWSLRTGAMWSASLPIANVTPPDGDFGAAAVIAVKRIGSPQIVAVFSHESVPGDPLEVRAAIFDGAAWSTPTPIATDLATGTVFTPFAIAAQPDGKVALAYRASPNKVKVGFYDGNTWSAFAEVPGVTTVGAYAPLALAPGVDGGNLELAFIDNAFHIQHTRLTATWSAPTSVNADRNYTLVALAVRK